MIFFFFFLEFTAQCEAEKGLAQISKEKLRSALAYSLWKLRGGKKKEKKEKSEKGKKRKLDRKPKEKKNKKRRESSTSTGNESSSTTCSNESFDEE